MTPQELMEETEKQILKNLEQDKPKLDKLLKKAQENFEKNKPYLDKQMKNTIENLKLIKWNFLIYFFNMNLKTVPKGWVNKSKSPEIICENIIGKFI